MDSKDHQVGADIEAMARKAGFMLSPDQPGEIFTESEDEISQQLARFTELVRSDLRLAAQIRNLVIEECAVICDGLESTWPKSGAAFGICAAAIRAAKQ